MAEDQPAEMPPRRSADVPGPGADGAAGVFGTARAAEPGDTEADDYVLPEQQEAPDAAKRRRKRNRVAFGVVAGVLAILLLGLAAIIGFYAKSANDAMNNMQRQPMLPQGERPPEPTAEDGKQAPVNILIMGTDSRGAGDQGRSDVLMMAHVSGDRKTVYLISFPRDLWVNVPGHGMAKINAAYAWGGMPLTVQTVEELTGAHVSHSSIVNFEGFVQVVDAIGGVTVYNHAASPNFPAGYIELDGQSALAFSRERYTLPNGDLDRARRQREVVMAVTRQMLTPEVLADPGRFNEAVNTLAPYFTVDEEFTKAEMTGLALSMRVTSGDSLRQLQAPILGFGTSADGQSIDLVDEEFMAELGTALQDDEMAAYWDKHRDDPPVRNP
ncbi:MAG: LCP family protein [Brooklawnia sp.]|uniref:LCP family protein n=1 Tax=Brooklawnia sp. TaxID=2699740 RepID=UPI003C71F49C